MLTNLRKAADGLREAGEVDGLEQRRKELEDLLREAQDTLRSLSAPVPAPASSAKPSKGLKSGRPSKTVPAAEVPAVSPVRKNIRRRQAAP